MHKVMVIGFVILFIPLLSIQSAEILNIPIHNRVLNQKNSSQNNITHQFYEDFTQLTYRDASTTTAFGWGEGFLSLPLLGIGDSKYLGLSSAAMDISVFNNFAFIGTYEHGLAIVNITDPDNLGQPVYVNVWGEFVVRGVHVVNDFAYLAISRSSPHGGALVVINVTDPLNPSSPVYKGISLQMYSIFVDGDYAYIASDSQIAIFNIENPLSPGEPNYYTITSSLRDIFIKDNYAFIATTGGLAVVDVSDPLNPSDQIFFNQTEGIWDIHVTGNYAFLALDESDKIAILDISDLLIQNDPIYFDMGSVGTPLDIYIDDNYAFVGTYSGLVILDISTPTRPIKLFYRALPNVVRGTQYFNGYGLVANSFSGLAILNLTETFNFIGAAVAQTFSVYNGDGYIRNVSVTVNQTIYQNTSTNHYISFDKNEWLVIDLNKTYSFPNNTKSSLYWRAELFTSGNQSPIIDILIINLDIFVPEDSTTITTTTTTTITAESTTTIIPTTILPGETQIADFSGKSEFSFHVTTTNSSSSSIIDLNNLQRGEQLEISVDLISGGSASSIQNIQGNLMVSEIFEWQLIDPNGNIDFSDIYSPSGNIYTHNIDQDGTWKLKFLWDGVDSPLTFSCYLKKNPNNTTPDLGFITLLSLLAIVSGTLGYFIYKNQQAHRKKEEPSPHVNKYLREEKTIRGYEKDPITEKHKQEQPMKSIVPQKSYQSEKRLTKDQFLVNSKQTVKKSTIKPIQTFEPKERISFFCQLDNAQHPKTESAYQCLTCSRMVCDSCYEKSKRVGVLECPFCDGSIVKIQ